MHCVHHAALLLLLPSMLFLLLQGLQAVLQLRRADLTQLLFAQPQLLLQGTKAVMAVLQQAAWGLGVPATGPDAANLLQLLVRQGPDALCDANTAVQMVGRCGRFLVVNYAQPCMAIYAQPHPSCCDVRQRWACVRSLPAPLFTLRPASLPPGPHPFTHTPSICPLVRYAGCMPCMLLHPSQIQPIVTALSLKPSDALALLRREVAAGQDLEELLSPAAVSALASDWRALSEEMGLPLRDVMAAVTAQLAQPDAR